ncbi:class I SAM-dependent methyltransferase [Planotetraspora kaengkrachanensis]|uniref:Methyltransferase n=1 Tax=Planotetraspora kaengkrachanensis TaxID=575193 RepID=A0A8J3PW56_9ACTN|nr:class I SAM-dependent methyltransferase [Planotetraspora kaengkrachanensis]GIG82102.1 methyltransferase [Planotetraspora kaengkrachanensis]
MMIGSLPSGKGSTMRLLDDETLEHSAVVANRTMNRERGLTGSGGYGRALGLDVLDVLRSRPSTRPVVRWLDLCCGEARALLEASEALGDDAEIVGVDLVDFFAGPSRPPRLRLITASITTWEPDEQFDLITCVHGLHYVGDKLGVLSRIPAWLTDGGMFVGDFDPGCVRLEDGSPAGRRLAAALRASGFAYDSRRHRITCGSGGGGGLPYRYLGSDAAAGPNYTGQPAVDSYYSFTG